MRGEVIFEDFSLEVVFLYLSLVVMLLKTFIRLVETQLEFVRIFMMRQITEGSVLLELTKFT